jgi:hypothetical protein
MQDPANELRRTPLPGTSVNRPRHVVTAAEYGSEGRRAAPLAENLAVQHGLTWRGLLLSVRAKAFDDLGMPKCARLAASDNHKQCALLVADVDEPSHGRARERDSVPGAKLHRLALVLAPEEVPPAVEYYEGLVRVVGVVGDPVVRLVWLPMMPTTMASPRCRWPWWARTLEARRTAAVGQGIPVVPSITQ